MARYFFDAASSTVAVADLQGREIHDKSDVRPAMVEAVRAIRKFVEEEYPSEEWSLEVRLGHSNTVATMRFEEIDACEVTADAGSSELLAA